MISIEAVSVCVNYSKYFKFAAERNRKHFKRWLVVTTSNDLDTQQICKQHDIECIIYDGFTDEHGPFQKSKGINKAFDKINFNIENEYVLHIDADIILPNNFDVQVMKNGVNDYWDFEGFNKRTIYGADRACIPNPSNESINEMFDIMNKYDLRGKNGYRVWGFFQLLQKEAIVHRGLLHAGKTIYPEMSPNAGLDDVIFSNLFLHKRTLNMTVVNLGEYDKRNWNGVDGN
jgi:hypothetical protein